jgi:23S rRNA (cytidine2498-2'-O)-methyltransferase
MQPPSPFLFVICQHGAEAALKREVARDRPELRFAFSRPGFVTFKAPAPLPLDYAFDAVFARAHGVSLGPVAIEAEATPAALAGAATAKVASLVAVESQAVSRLRLHVIERELHAPGEEPAHFVPGSLARAAHEALRTADRGGLYHASARAELGDTVVDLIVVDESTWWLGLHAHHASHSPWPGGRPDHTLPPEAPSRAYLKLEEALAWSGLPLHRGETALEIGSAPGGASHALLSRGLRVIGIDSAAMDARVLDHPAFTHIARSVQSVRREELPRRIDWLLLDLNLAPDIALRQAARLAARVDTLRGVILTLKLNHPNSDVELPSWMEFVREMGMENVRAKQLASHRREVVVVGTSHRV